MGDHQATYESEPQRSVRQWVKSHPLFDWLYAAYENTRWSAGEIEPFIRKYHIDMSEFEPIEYRSFAEFFDRRFRPGVRKFPSAAGEMGAFAEARYFAWDKLDPEQQFPVKGHSLSADRILGTAERARPFIAGPVLLVRLAPVDCHHVHYPDHGRTLDQDRLGHRLWTVNWHALVNKPDILFSNERISSARWRVDAGTSSATSEVLKIIHTRRSEQRICGVARSPSSTCRRYDGRRSELV